MNIKLVGTILFGVIGLIVALVAPIGAVSRAGNLVAGSITIALGLWVFRPAGIPYAAGCAVFLGGCLIAGLKFPVVMNGYSSSAIWILIPALFFGYVLQKTGLAKRIVYWTLKSIKPTYLTIILAWVFAGIILSLLTPSAALRILTMIPIALATVEACGLEFRSRGGSLICLTAFGMALLPGGGWYTGCLWGPVFIGMFPAELKSLGTPNNWLLGNGLYWAVATLLYIIVLNILLKPERPLQLDRHAFKAQYDQLGSMSRDERVVMVVLVAAFAMFFTESIHRIPTVPVALAGFFLLMAFGVITAPDINTGVNWDMILFVGAVISLPAISVESGIAKWMAGFMDPFISAWAGSPVIFLILFVLIYWLIRFLDVSWGFATAALMAPIMVPLYNNFGIHPVIVGVVFAIGGGSFFFSYQQPFIVMSESMTKGNVWSPQNLTRGGLAYGIACLAAILIVAPYWKAIKFIP
jgi:di/tricarboxylate transporter